MCPAGFYESSNGSKCVICDKGHWCRGGNGNGASKTSQSLNNTTTNVPTSADGVLNGARSYMVQCGTSLTTTLKGAKAETSCGELMHEHGTA